MKKTKFSEAQILGVLKEAEDGIKVSDLARKHGVSEATIYMWRSKYGGMELHELKRMRELEGENARLKRIVADQQLDIQILKDVNSKKW
jgi:putative transposase